MAVIRQDTIQIRVEGGKIVDFKRKTKFEVRIQRFSIVLPDFWAKVLGYSEVGAETLQQVDAAWNKARSEFDEKVTTKRKVILYNFKAKAVKNLYDAKGEIVRTTFREDDLAFAKGTGLTLWFEVCYEMKSSHSAELSYVNMKGNHVCRETIERPIYKKIDWTAEREAFFVQFDAHLTDMIVKLHVFLTGDSKALEVQIDTYKNVLALPEPEGDEGK